jgi:hypothetical protein
MGRSYTLLKPLIIVKIVFRHRNDFAPAAMICRYCVCYNNCLVLSLAFVHIEQVVSAIEQVVSAIEQVVSAIEQVVSGAGDSPDYSL